MEPAWLAGIPVPEIGFRDPNSLAACGQ